ncbi:ribonuclease activity regulator RraA [Jiangella sp. DSM 45060]|uniref:RraA family protein n=1 Tax=Jiangella sp. DSM 45060 TaxID=1798224 RepID=UPI00087C55C5|nr:ribonuclease activity regulator RraA [Jiangella sp. DSM 45060]SDT72777.1 Regulator of RNase E activity RraA [Jiangella sp. DSM 45060]
MNTEQDGYPTGHTPLLSDPPGRPARALVEALSGVSAATACAKLHHQGVTRTFIDGPAPLHRDAEIRVTGAAVTLQFMPQREDVFTGQGQEDAERRSALWAVLESIRPGDVLVVSAQAAQRTGCLGDMLVRYFKLRGGAGIVVDGRIRDAGRVRALGVPVWCTGVTPHYASQTELFPYAYNVPVAVGGALVRPGDLVIADDDGAVVVPPSHAQAIADDALAHQDKEEFARRRLDAGGRLSDYYPLTGRGLDEYVAHQGSSNGR